MWSFALCHSLVARSPLHDRQVRRGVTAATARSLPILVGDQVGVAPYILKTKPYIRILEQYILNPKPKTLYPLPYTLNPKP